MEGGQSDLKAQVLEAEKELAKLKEALKQKDEELKKQMISKPQDTPFTVEIKNEKVPSAISSPAAEPNSLEDGFRSSEKKIVSSILKSLMKHQVAERWFNQPVDPIAMSIPDYLEIIKKPMDFSTISRKFESDSYSSANEFIEDVKLIFQNCMTYNKPGTLVYQECKLLESFFNEKLPKLTKEINRHNEESIDKKELLKRSNTTDGSQEELRPKRIKHTPLPKDTLPCEIHPPKPTPKKMRFKGKLKQCASILKELSGKKNYHYAIPFLKPVDPVALNIPDYLTIIKYPMDFETVTKKLYGGEYQNIDQFAHDVRLIFSNCVKYNSAEHKFSKDAEYLQNIFDTRIAALKASNELMEDSNSDSSSEEQTEKKRKRLRSVEKPVAHEAPPIESKKPHPPITKLIIKPPEYREMTFEEKEALQKNLGLLPAEAIQEIAVIIQSRIPDLEGGDEFEVDINSLDSITLRQMEEFTLNYLKNHPELKHEKQEEEEEEEQPQGKKYTNGSDDDYENDHVSYKKNGKAISDSPSPGKEISKTL